MKMLSLSDLFEDQLKDLYSAEKQLIKALPKMAKRASSPALKSALEHHLEETEGQVERIEEIATMMNLKITGKKCAAMEGLIEEGKEVMEADGDDSIIDAAIVAAAQRVEHYEIAAYGTARALAQLLEQEQVAELLQNTLEEEGEADKKLTELVEGEIYPACQSVGMDESDEGEDETNSRSKSKMMGSGSEGNRGKGQSERRSGRNA